jgi:hypothetical protein
LAGPDLRHRMQQAVRGNARRNRSSRPPQEKTALHPPVPWQSNFPNTLRLGDTRSLFSGTRGGPDRDGAGARPHTRHGQLPSTPLTASVLRDIEGGVPVEADHILGDLLRGAGVAADNRTLVRIANAHAKAYEARRARNRAAVASAAPSSHTRGRHMSEPSTKPQKLRQLPALYRAFAGLAANLAIEEASPAQGGSSRRGNQPD